MAKIQQFIRVSYNDSRQLKEIDSFLADKLIDMQKDEFLRYRPNPESIPNYALILGNYRSEDNAILNERLGYTSFNTRLSEVIQQYEEIRAKDPNQSTTEFDRLIGEISFIRGPISLHIATNKVARETIATAGEQVFGNINYRSFIDDRIRELIEDPRYKPLKTLEVSTNLVKPSNTIKDTIRASVWLWSKTLGSGNDLQGGCFNLTPFLISLETNVTIEGGNFNITLPPITCECNDVQGWDVKAKALQTNEQGFYVYRDSIDGNESTSNLFFEVEGSSKKRNTFLFHQMISANDLVFIKFENLQIETDRNLTLDPGKKISTFDLPNQVYDMIGLVDRCKISYQAETNDVSITVTGRDLVKVLIDDGTYFFPLEAPFFNNSPSGLFQYQNRQQLGRPVERIFGSLAFLSAYVDRTIEFTMKFIVNNLSNIQICDRNVFEYFEEKSTRFLIQNDSAEEQRKYNEAITRRESLWRNERFILDENSNTVTSLIFIYSRQEIKGITGNTRADKISFLRSRYPEIKNRIIPKQPPLPSLNYPYEITPRRQAILNTIAWAEGTFNNYTAYFNNGFENGRKVATVSLNGPHPDVPIKWPGSDIGSTAAGRYQFLSRADSPGGGPGVPKSGTWYETIRALGLPDIMSISNQDQVALHLIFRKGVLGIIDQDSNFDAVLNALSYEWASLPTAAGGSRYGQSKFTPAQVRDRFLTELERLEANLQPTEEQVLQEYEEFLQTIERINTPIPKPEQNVQEEEMEGVWSIIRLVIDEEIANRRIVDSSIATQSGPIINFIRKVCLDPFVEFFTDTYGDRFYFIARKPPFSRTSYRSNYTITIDSSKVLSDDLEFNDRNIYSWYQLIPQGNYMGQGDQIALYDFPAIFFAEYAQIYGSRPYTVVSNYVDYKGVIEYEPGSQNLERLREQALIDLRFMIEINAYNPFVRQGTIVIYGDRRIKRGMNIYYAPTGELFYVEGVQQSERMGDDYDRVTILQVSHGMVFEHYDKYFDVVNYNEIVEQPQETIEQVPPSINVAVNFDSDKDIIIIDSDDIELIQANDETKQLLSTVEGREKRKRLADESRIGIDKIKSFIIQYPNSRIEIVGHTDSDASASYNADLSERRAKRVRKIVIDELTRSGNNRSTLEQRILFSGAGESRRLYVDDANLFNLDPKAIEKTPAQLTDRKNKFLLVVNQPTTLLTSSQRVQQILQITGDDIDIATVEAAALQDNEAVRTIATELERIDSEEYRNEISRRKALNRRVEVRVLDPLVKPKKQTVPRRIPNYSVNQKFFTFLQKRKQFCSSVQAQKWLDSYEQNNIRETNSSKEPSIDEIING